ncbi:MAG: phosphoenolpyruvate--protein phosphotransferase [Blautia sp.]|uniref:phosphoenolpyruvate--protein phosphotransferase n=1 Tax=unclassified Blautia TaxID=2648079 RepID=UPI0025BF0BE6|nr:phosphoenolpyruvate--protein phosphotransferase [Blautia sp.]MCI6302556.1 phosphoenolpyruvate--protein phosphotransferase [Blautia sp.]MCI7448992.1 phosphoenolpyruvate--protein phosphotransferase [Blautia sp.]MDD6415337.1 phosphoenolpyruvate--protein phosphotransferase [Blautia sp.]MDY4116569.1 phosphoenolpyruvate--protein phosphotransferase [Blautia sp.]
MDIYKGTGAFPGIAIGKIVYYHKSEYQIRQYEITDVKSELSIFRQARARVIEQLTELYEKNCMIQESQAELFLRQKELLEGKSFQRAIESIIQNEKVNSAYAVMTTRDEILSTFRNLEEPAIKERLANIREISDRLISELGGVSPRIDLGDEPVIVVTESITPTELMEMDKDKLMAIVTHHGSDISHAAILVKTMNIPALIEIDTDTEWDGQLAIVDGYTGCLYINPDEEVKKEYEIRRQADMEEREELLKLREEPDVTKDGRRIEIYANIGNMDDLNSVLYYGAAGIGLLRSEFQYLGRENYPRENELFLAYKKIAETLGDRIAVIRTADLGADKQAEYLNIPDETNPIMGNRGIRLCLDRKKMFKAQLRAIFRASAYGNLALMYPMISSEEEMDEIDAIIQEVKKGLDDKGIPYKNVKTGIMIETPAAVMISRELARRVDFLSLGTNDLSQYTLAMDRQNPLLRKKYNDHHPAVLRMIRMVIEAGHAENKRVCICGELAADTALTEEFLRMGVDCLSVVPACILPVRKALRQADLSGDNKK